jgi:hypothetical protein
MTDSERDLFNVSKGNITVLEVIPRMMQNEKYRALLRKLAIDFLYGEVTK